MSSLTHRRSLPPGATVTMRTMRDGWALRSMVWPPGARGSLLFIGGRGDFIEKYAETLWHWRDAGFGLAAFDWRGQGRSGRVARAQGGSAGFDALVADLGEQIAWFQAELPRPYYAVAHSMGGHLLLRRLVADPASLDRAVLLAPMLGLVAAPVGPWLARQIARLQVRRGQAHAFVPGAGHAQTADPRRGARLSSDPERVADEAWWVARDPELGSGGVTNGWLAAAFASLDNLTAPGVLEAVSTPLLVLTAGTDRLVDSPAAMRFARRLPNARVESIDGAAHELLREGDAMRARALALIDGFLG